MDATRRRLGSVMEWAPAAGFFVAGVMLVVALAADARSVRPVVPVLASSTALPQVPAIAPAGAVSLPLLLLPDGLELRLNSDAAVLGSLGRDAVITAETVERDTATTAGERIARSYEYRGVSFVVVTANDRLVAIFRR